MYDTLKSAISNVIKSDPLIKISGDALQAEIFRVIDTIGAGYIDMGVADLDSNPESQEGNLIYTANLIGVYPDLGEVEITEAGLYAIRRIDGAWTVILLQAAVSTDITETIRKTMLPSTYVSYLPKDYNSSIGYVTASVSANTPTKILIPTTIKKARDFAVVDKGDGSFAVQYQNAATRDMALLMTTSMLTGTNNVVFTIELYKNGVMIPGIGISRKIATGTDVGAIAVGGEFSVSQNDYLEIYITVNLTSTVTFRRTAIRLIEVN